MKSRHLVFTFAGATLLQLFTPPQLCAQDIAVFSSYNVAIEDGSVLPSQFNETDFGKVGVDAGVMKSASLYYTTTLEDTFAIITGPVTLSGPDAADFSIAQPNIGQPINSSTFAFFGIDFNPSAVGIRNATVTIPNNDPDAEGVYTFAIRGEGVAGISVPAVPDLRASYKKQAKITVNKSGQGKVILQATAENAGNVDAEGALLRLYLSDDEFLDSTDIIVKEKAIKRLPIANPKTGKVKKKSAKLKLNVGQQTSGYIFVQVFQTDGTLDQNAPDNVNFSSFFAQIPQP